MPELSFYYMVSIIDRNMLDIQCHSSSKRTLCVALRHNWALILTAVTQSQAGRAWPTTAAGENLEKQNGKRGTKSFRWPRLCQLTQRGWAKIWMRQHRAEDTEDLHHIKGNIFFLKNKQTKKTRSYRRAAPSSAEPCTQGSLSKQFVMYRTIHMNRQRLCFAWTHLFLRQLHRIKMGFLSQH